ncbi:MAG: hypothetical protein HYR63_01845 [Proteobacteria bacterium]|nr:hypothetical protein [Pseudomonadota bacterium]
MQKFILIAVFALFGLLPFAASAQQRGPAPAQQAPAQVAEGVNLNKAIAIGVGVVVGAVVLESLAVGDAMVLVGGVAGGLIGAWWYDNAGDSLTRTAIRQPAAMTIAFRTEPAEQSF